MHARGDAGVEGEGFFQRGLHIGMAAEVDALRVGHKQAAAFLMHLEGTIGQGRGVDVVKRHCLILLLFRRIQTCPNYHRKSSLETETIERMRAAQFLKKK